MKLQKLLEEREKELRTAMEKCRKILDKSPDTSLEVQKCNGRFCHYLSWKDDETGATVRKYATKDKMREVSRIAQRDYAAKLLKSAETEHRRIKALLHIWNGKNSYEVHEQLKEGRRRLTYPLLMSDAEYVEHWLEQRSEHVNSFPYENEFYTVKGERVRSKSEKIIADALAYMEIPYKYEEPVECGEARIYPDFTVLDIYDRKEWYWEHFGLMDDDEYRGKMLDKLDSYAQNGIIVGKNLIITMEGTKHSLQTPYLEQVIKNCFVH